MSVTRSPRSFLPSPLLASALLATACGGVAEHDGADGSPDAISPGPGDEAVVVAPTAGGLTLAAESFRPGEPIALTYRLEGPAAGGTWVGVIPAEITSTSEADNDAADIAYEYVPEGSTSGSLRIAGSAGPGSYRLRLFGADDDGAPMLAESPVFAVRAWSWPERGGPVLTLSATELAGDDDLTVHFELPEALPEQAWVGIVPAAVTSLDQADNDSADVAYEYVTGTSGRMRFVDLPEGEYAVRLFPCSEAPCSAVAEAGPVTVR